MMDPTYLSKEIQRVLQTYKSPNPAVSSMGTIMLHSGTNQPLCKLDLTNIGLSLPVKDRYIVPKYIAAASSGNSSQPAPGQPPKHNNSSQAQVIDGIQLVNNVASFINDAATILSPPGKQIGVTGSQRVMPCRVIGQPDSQGIVPIVASLTVDLGAFASVPEMKCIQGRMTFYGMEFDIRQIRSTNVEDFDNATIHRVVADTDYSSTSNRFHSFIGAMTSQPPRLRVVITTSSGKGKVPISPTDELIAATTTQQHGASSSQGNWDEKHGLKPEAAATGPSNSSEEFDKHGQLTYIQANTKDDLFPPELGVDTLHFIVVHPREAVEYIANYVPRGYVVVVTPERDSDHSVGSARYYALLLARMLKTSWAFMLDDNFAPIDVVVAKNDQEKNPKYVPNAPYRLPFPLLTGIKLLEDIQIELSKMNLYNNNIALNTPMPYISATAPPASTTTAGIIGSGASAGSPIPSSAASVANGSTSNELGIAALDGGESDILTTTGPLHGTHHLAGGGSTAVAPGMLNAAAAVVNIAAAAASNTTTHAINHSFCSYIGMIGLTRLLSEGDDRTVVNDEKIRQLLGTPNSTPTKTPASAAKGANNSNDTTNEVFSADVNICRGFSYLHIDALSSRQLTYRRDMHFMEDLYFSQLCLLNNLASMALNFITYQVTNEKETYAKFDKYLKAKGAEHRASTPTIVKRSRSRGLGLGSSSTLASSSNVMSMSMATALLPNPAAALSLALSQSYSMSLSHSQSMGGTQLRALVVGANAERERKAKEDAANAAAEAVIAASNDRVIPPNSAARGRSLNRTSNIPQPSNRSLSPSSTKRTISPSSTRGAAVVAPSAGSGKSAKSVTKPQPDDDNRSVGSAGSAVKQPARSTSANRTKPYGYSSIPPPAPTNSYILRKAAATAPPPAPPKTLSTPVKKSVTERHLSPNSTRSASTKTNISSATSTSLVPPSSATKRSTTPTSTANRSTTPTNTRNSAAPVPGSTTRTKSPSSTNVRSKSPSAMAMNSSAAPAAAPRSAPMSSEEFFKSITSPTAAPAASSAPKKRQSLSSAASASSLAPAVTPRSRASIGGANATASTAGRSTTPPRTGAAPAGNALRNSASASSTTARPTTPTRGGAAPVPVPAPIQITAAPVAQPAKRATTPTSTSGHRSALPQPVRPLKPTNAACNVTSIALTLPPPVPATVTPRAASASNGLRRSSSSSFTSVGNQAPVVAPAPVPAPVVKSRSTTPNSVGGRSTTPNSIGNSAGGRSTTPQQRSTTPPTLAPLTQPVQLPPPPSSSGSTTPVSIRGGGRKALSIRELTGGESDSISIPEPSPKLVTISTAPPAVGPNGAPLPSPRVARIDQVPFMDNPLYILKRTGSSSTMGSSITSRAATPSGETTPPPVNGVSHAASQDGTFGTGGIALVDDEISAVLNEPVATASEIDEKPVAAATEEIALPPPVDVTSPRKSFSGTLSTPTTSTPSKKYWKKKYEEGTTSGSSSATSTPGTSSRPNGLVNPTGAPAGGANNAALIAELAKSTTYNNIDDDLDTETDVHVIVNEDQIEEELKQVREEQEALAAVSAEHEAQFVANNLAEQFTSALNIAQEEEVEPEQSQPEPVAELEPVVASEPEVAALPEPEPTPVAEPEPVVVEPPVRAASPVQEEPVVVEPPVRSASPVQEEPVVVEPPVRAATPVQQETLAPVVVETPVAPAAPVVVETPVAPAVATATVEVATPVVEKAKASLMVEVPASEPVVTSTNSSAADLLASPSKDGNDDEEDGEEDGEVTTPINSPNSTKTGSGKKRKKKRNNKKK